MIPSKIWLLVFRPPIGTCELTQKEIRHLYKGFISQLNVCMYTTDTLVVCIHSLVTTS